MRLGLPARRKILAATAVAAILSPFVLIAPPAYASTYSRTVDVGGVVLTVSANYNAAWDWNLRNDVNLGIALDSVPSNFLDLRILDGSTTMHQNGTNDLLATSAPPSLPANSIVLTSPGASSSTTFSFDHTYNGMHAQPGRLYTAHILVWLNMLVEAGNGSRLYTFENGDSDMVFSLNTSNPHPQPSFLGLSMWGLLLLLVTVISSIGAILLWLSRTSQGRPSDTSTTVTARWSPNRRLGSENCR